MVGFVATRKSDRSGVVAPLDVKTLLASVEAAPPIDAAEVVAAALTGVLAFAARDVSFLIADYSRPSLNPLSHVRRMNADDDGSQERGRRSRWPAHRIVARSRSRSSSG